MLVGGSPNPGPYEMETKSVNDGRIIFPGYVYGDDANILIRNAYAYIQPSLIEGLSPVILTVMAIGTPLICSDIKEHVFITKTNATHFSSGNADSLHHMLDWALKNREILSTMAEAGKQDVCERFNWKHITDQYLGLLKKK